MKPKSHEMQLLRTAVHGGEHKTPLQLNTVFFFFFSAGENKEKKQIRFSNPIRINFKERDTKDNNVLSKADSTSCQFSETRKKVGHLSEGRENLSDSK